MRELKSSLKNKAIHTWRALVNHSISAGQVKRLLSKFRVQNSGAVLFKPGVVTHMPWAHLVIILLC